ncbi:MAG: hypothetical protein E6R03_15505 [Hyphomicrobiaceae bacterium]|nr:MAG: hypothetical protein E6R03_15505 [Hyphomicrobiaceae bacterium]
MVKAQLGEGGMLHPYTQAVEACILMKQEQLLNQPLLSQEGVNRALGLQHEARGLRMALNILYDLSNEEFTQ